jgi:hypothetical protein
MAYQLVTCPETAHVELIEHEQDPLGLLILACSRFRPPWDLQCARTCATRMDRRDRVVVLASGEETQVDVPRHNVVARRARGR